MSKGKSMTVSKANLDALENRLSKRMRSLAKRVQTLEISLHLAQENARSAARSADTALYVANRK
jgi:hypothetical protein